MEGCQQQAARRLCCSRSGSLDRSLDYGDQRRALCSPGPSPLALKDGEGLAIRAGAHELEAAPWRQFDRAANPQRGIA